MRADFKWKRKAGGLLPRALAWAAAGIALALAGCGDFSLVTALRGDSPGELRLSPTTALVPENTAFSFMVLGGVLPYSLAGSAALTSTDEHTYVFEGGTAPAGGTLDYPIEATDLLGITATAVVTVYALPPMAISAQSVTLLEGDSWSFAVTGGQSPYTWSLEGVPLASGDTYTFLSVSAGSYTLSVSDNIGVTRAATVQVVPDPGVGSALAITPASATVLPGGTVVFTALGGSGTYTFSASGGTVVPAPDGNPATYTAPAVKATYTVGLSDDGGLSFPVSAAVSVVTSPLQALLLTPESPTVWAVGDTIEFTVTGGTAPFAFSTDHPAWGSIEAVAANRAVYTQLADRNVTVRVTDADGTSTSTGVKWQ